jgi:hypothetical protein
MVSAVSVFDHLLGSWDPRSGRERIVKVITNSVQVCLEKDGLSQRIELARHKAEGKKDWPVCRSIEEFNNEEDNLCG